MDGKKDIKFRISVVWFIFVVSEPFEIFHTVEAVNALRDLLATLNSVHQLLHSLSHTHDADAFLFSRGPVYHGIYFPSLSAKLQDDRLEMAYLKYAHRQRQKSLMLVNSADIILKLIILLKVFCYIDSNDTKDSNENPDPGVSVYVNKISTILGFFGRKTGFGQCLYFFQRSFGSDIRTCYLVNGDQLITLICCLGSAVVINFMLGLVSWWKCYANNFLHWGALVTWFILLVQGEISLLSFFVKFLLPLNTFILDG